MWLVRKDAAPKLSGAILMFGQPSWDPVPTWLKSRGWLGPAPSIPEIAIYKALSYRMLSALNLKYLPVLISRALGTQSIADYHMFHMHNFCEMLYGRGSYAAPNRCQSVIENVQELA